MVLRVKRTPTRFPTNSLYISMGSTLLHSMPNVCHPWGSAGVWAVAHPGWWGCLSRRKPWVLPSPRHKGLTTMRTLFTLIKKKVECLCCPVLGLHHLCSQPTFFITWWPAHLHFVQSSGKQITASGKHVIRRKPLQNEFLSVTLNFCQDFRVKARLTFWRVGLVLYWHAFGSYFLCKCPLVNISGSVYLVNRGYIVSTTFSRRLLVLMQSYHINW